MARKYAGYKRISIKVVPMGSRFGVLLLSGNGRQLMRTSPIDGHEKDSANAIACLLSESFRPSCTVRLTLAE